MTAAEKIAILDVGQVWEDNDEDRYIVARIGNTPKSFCLISLISGNRWADACKLKNVFDGDEENFSFIKSFYVLKSQIFRSKNENTK